MQMSAEYTLIVQNTFLCLVGGEPESPMAGFGRKRAATDPEDASSTRSTAMVSDREEGLPLEDDAASSSPSAGEDDLDFEADVDGTGCPTHESLASLVFDRVGAGAVQRALEAGRLRAPLLAAALSGRVPEAARCPHAHEVLLAALHYLPTEDTAFITEGLRGHVRELALTSHGASVLCELLAFSGTDARTAAVIDEAVADDAAALTVHKAGHRVASAIMECGLPHQKRKVVGALLINVQRAARHRFASPVLESALLAGSDAESRSLRVRLLAHQGTIVSLACHGFGVGVVRALLALDGAVARQTLRFLQNGTHRLAKDRFGAELMQELGMEA